ncbi:unnamed protein product [Linum trigynum]|uniref:Uncharacterized protein n=1 Tax=Linum trigynum TaxID=586398 RepID=A0AAV2FAR3_9ROSI
MDPSIRHPLSHYFSSLLIHNNTRSLPPLSSTSSSLPSILGFVCLSSSSSPLSLLLRENHTTSSYPRPSLLRSVALSAKGIGIY